ncbi:MAG: hypothetical protein HFJ10_05325 [Lachnospiraceae bacterium]|nr:hypothetical protein [Lachnospiraceae bacterium]
MRTGISLLIILILLPYVAVVFRTGSMKGLSDEAKEPGIEEYVKGILPGQMPATCEEEALKSQAVIIRTNLLRKSMEFYQKEDLVSAAEAIREEDLAEMGFTYYSPLELEKMWGYDQFDRFEAKIQKVVEETAGKILTLEGKPLDLPYHAVSAGQTRDGQVLGDSYSYLEAVECTDDLRSEDYLEIQTLSIQNVPEILSRDESGYVTEIRLGEETLAGEEFRDRYHLNSSCFTVESVEEGVRVTTKGLGHGLGLSIYQANLQAQNGWTCLEILSYFYKNVECISFS